MEKFTLEERMLLCTGKGAWHTQTIEGKLPSIALSDGPHGLRKQNDGQTNNDSVPATCFPTASALACSFDEELVGEVASSIAKEAYNENVSILLGPGINMKRSPTCGRNFEYFSEDPYLAAALGTSYVKAVESLGVGTCLKHYAANSQETKRMASNSIVDEKALRSIYLRAFEHVIKQAKPSSIMASYNRINNVYATENQYLLKDILRKEWGFEGAVISDWGASTNLSSSIKGGTSLEMPSYNAAHLKLLKKDFKKGIISEEDIISSSNDVIKLANKFSLDNKDKKYDISMNHDVAIKASTESSVLLKNDGVLPLETKRVTIIGGLAEKIRYQGGGSSHINTLKVKDPIKAFEEEGYEVSFAKGYNVENSLDDENLIKNALEVAKDAEIILFYGGLTDIAEGEGFDRKDFGLPKNQINLLEKLYEINPNIVFISFQGSPYDMEPLSKSRAILSMYLSGEGISEAIVKLVSGQVNPSGKLAETIPFKLEDTPAYGEFATGSKNIRYKESIFIGYRYYDTFDIPVRYPFGYGLSYTKFEYSNLEIKEIKENTFEVSFDITNIGEREGKEIAEVYVLPTRTDYLRPKRELKGFKKVSLKPHETKRVTIVLDEESFKEYDIEKGWLIPEDEVTIQVSSSIDNPILEGKVSVRGQKNLSMEPLYFSYLFDKRRKIKNVSDEEFDNLLSFEPLDLNVTPKGEYSITNSLYECSRRSLKAKFLLWFAYKVTYASFKGKPKDDPEVMMQIETIRDGTLDCILMQGGIPYRIGESIILSCNGHRLRALIKLIGG